MMQRPSIDDLKSVRAALGLSQPEMGRVLGLAHKSLARLESQGGSSESGWTAGATRRILVLLRSLPVSAVPNVVCDLVALHAGADRPADASVIGTRVAHGLEQTIGRFDVTERAEARGLALGQLVDRWVARGRSAERAWVYWATSERADAAGTLDLAREHGVICRPLFDSLGRPNDYLAHLKPNDLLLLYHDEAAQGWFRLAEIEGVAPRAVVSASGERAQDLHRLVQSGVVRFVRRGDPLGKLLAQPEWGYRLFDNRPAESSPPSAYFSCLSVTKEPSKPSGAPQRRRPGERARITPYMET